MDYKGRGLSVDGTRITNVGDPVDDKDAASKHHVSQANKVLASRVSVLERSMFTNLKGNKFLVSFDTLDGIHMINGVWNEALERMEC